MPQYIFRLWHLAGAEGSMGFLALVESEKAMQETGGPDMMGVGRLTRSSVWDT